MRCTKEKKPQDNNLSYTFYMCKGQMLNYSNVYTVYKAYIMVKIKIKQLGLKNKV